MSSFKWSNVDPIAADALTQATDTPGVVFPMGTNQLPHQLQQMPGVSAYYISGFTTGQPLSQGLTIGGEMLVARSADGLTKNYQFAFATSSNGQVCFAGPFKGYGHYVSSGQSISIEALFGNTPFSNRTGG